MQLKDKKVLIFQPLFNESIDKCLLSNLPSHRFQLWQLLHLKVHAIECQL